MHFLLATTEITKEAGSANLFEALGINAQLLITQGLAFLVLVFLLGKFVYPALIKAIDNRRSAIESSMEEAKEAQVALQKAEAKVADMLSVARKEADDILTRSHQEAAAAVSEAETKAKARADQIVKSARSQLEADVTKARAELKQDTIKLVALATEKIIKEKIDERKDSSLIKQALEEKV